MKKLAELLNNGWIQVGPNFGEKGGDKPLCILVKDGQLAVIDRFNGTFKVPPTEIPKK